MQQQHSSHVLTYRHERHDTVAGGTVWYLKVLDQYLMEQLLLEQGQKEGQARNQYR